MSIGELVLSADRAVSQREVMRGLTRTPKMISPKWFYDERGSRLFNEICNLPEYYLTRAELAIMRTHGNEVAACLPNVRAVIEYGSGSSRKTRLLLGHLPALDTYVPVDISAVELNQAATAIREDFPELNVQPVCADFTLPFALPFDMGHETPRLLYMPGSTLGNFEESDACMLLAHMNDLAGADGHLLIGIDLRKDREVLESAYNDRQGVTALFNLNALEHMNQTLGSNFEVNRFEHRAVWVEEFSRMEMYLICREAHDVTIGGHIMHFESGEHVVTEYSHKYAPEVFENLAAAAGWRIERSWTDVRQYFAVYLLQRAEDLLERRRRASHRKHVH